VVVEVVAMVTGRSIRRASEALEELQQHQPGSIVDIPSGLTFEPPRRRRVLQRIGAWLWESLLEAWSWSFGPEFVERP
jgi:hypothetical protein